MGRRTERTVLVLGTLAHPWEIEEAFPDCRGLIAAGAGVEELVAGFWERSVQLEAIVARDALPVPDLLAFLVPEGSLLVTSRLVEGDAWRALMESSWFEERQLTVRVVQEELVASGGGRSW